jgi:hypothetical protein
MQETLFVEAGLTAHFSAFHQLFKLTHLTVFHEFSLDSVAATGCQLQA